MEKAAGAPGIWGVSKYHITVTSHSKPRSSLETEPLAGNHTQLVGGEVSRSALPSLPPPTRARWGAFPHFIPSPRLLRWVCRQRRNMPGMDYGLGSPSTKPAPKQPLPFRSLKISVRFALVCK